MLKLLSKNGRGTGKTSFKRQGGAQAFPFGIEKNQAECLPKLQIARVIA